MDYLPALQWTIVDNGGGARQFGFVNLTTPINRLLYGDCLTFLREWKWDLVDLIYLDPPFNSNRSYNAIYKDATGRPLPAQIEAFCDMWQLDGHSERALQNLPKLANQQGVSQFAVDYLRSWENVLRDTNPQLLAYLIYMTERLICLKSILKPTGSLYLHCDPTASHYLKITLDGIFGPANFRNEIVWKRTSSRMAKHKHPSVHDTILFYANPEHRLNKVFTNHDPEYLQKFYRNQDEFGHYMVESLAGPGITKTGDSGKPWRGVDPTKAKRHWAMPGTFPSHVVKPANWNEMPIHEKLDYLDSTGLIHWPKKTGGIPRFKRYLSTSKGRVMTDMILDVPPLSAHSKEKLDFPTQKPLALLDRIIQASSNEGDLVLDPFCGCGTTVEAAHNLERRWIGIDIAIHAVKRVSAVRLEDHLGLIAGRDYVLDGIPKDLEGARQLWEQDPWQFQKWAVEQVGGFVTSKRTADGGIDGRLWFAGEGNRLEEMILEVKGGKPNIQFVRALAGVRQQRKAAMAGLILLPSPSPVQRRNFEREMAGAGSVEVLGSSYARLQLLTVEEILAGKRFQTPGVAGKTSADPVLPMG